MKVVRYTHIRRIDNDTTKTHSWGVTLQRHKVVSTKMFSDSVWGGKRAALAAAIAWRDEQLQARAEFDHKLWRRNKLRRNNSSGVAGVARYEPRASVGRPASGAPYWQASWSDIEGVRHARKFSVKRWGEHGAKQKAMDERDKQLRIAAAARVAAKATR